MTLRAEVVATVVRIDILFVCRSIVHPFEHLMQLVEVIDIVFKLSLRIAGGCLNIDLHDVASLVSRVDLALTTITCVVNHPSSACEE